MEKNKKNILFLFLLLFLISFDTAAQIKDVPIVRLFEKEYYKYDIKNRESLYSICKKFNVTEAEILSMNPFIVDGLKSGQTLMIPIKNSKSSTAPTPVINNEPVLKAQTETKKTPKKADNMLIKPRITVMLPFAMNTTPGINDRYIEFYEGLLLAVDSLKTLGLSFEVQALESGTDAETINQAILTGKLKNTDYCIGGTTPEQISILAQWAKKNQKILILPFSSRIPEMDNNPYLFQTNTPHNFMYDHLVSQIVDRIKNTNIVFVNVSADDSDISKMLLPQIKSELRKKGIGYKEVLLDEQLTALSKALVSNQENSIIPSSFSASETSQFTTRLTIYSSENPDLKINLQGYPDWQVIGKTYQNQFYKLNTYLFSNFYADSQKQNVSDFQTIFEQTFGKSQRNTYPKYSMMGYDIAAYFIPRMVFEKSETPENMPILTPLQNQFRFNANKPMSGAFNQLFYIVHFKTDHTVEVLPIP